MSDNYKLHPFLQQAIDGETVTQNKALQKVVTTLEGLETVFRSNAKELVQLVRATDFLVEKTEHASAKSDEAIKTLALRLTEIEKIAQAVESSLGDINRTLEQNGTDFKNLKSLLSDFPAMLSQLKKMLGALDSRLAKPLEVRVELPAVEPVQELLPSTFSMWNTLVVDVVDRNFQGNIESVRIRRET